MSRGCCFCMLDGKIERQQIDQDASVERLVISGVRTLCQTKRQKRKKEFPEKKPFNEAIIPFRLKSFSPL